MVVSAHEPHQTTTASSCQQVLPMLSRQFCVQDRMHVFMIVI